MVKAILACYACLLYWMGMFAYPCPPFGGGVAHHGGLAHCYATGYHDPFISQTLVYILVFSSNEYREVTGRIFLSEGITIPLFSRLTVVNSKCTGKSPRSLSG